MKYIKSFNESKSSVEKADEIFTNYKLYKDGKGKSHDGYKIIDKLINLNKYHFKDGVKKYYGTTKDNIVLYKNGTTFNVDEEIWYKIKVEFGIRSDVRTELLRNILSDYTDDKTIKYVINYSSGKLLRPDQSKKLIG